MVSRKRIAISLVSAGIVGAGGWMLLHHRQPQPHPPVVVAKPSPVAIERTKIDAKFGSAPKEAKKAYVQFVETHAKSADKKVQDQVSAARLRIGYLTAQTDGMKAARAQFLLTANSHQGTDAMNPDFGTLPDQAAYQAIACLDGEGKKGEAEQEYVKFLKERPYSPLVHAVRKRLVRLNGGEPKPEWDNLLQADIAKQEARIRFETSVCGPKTIEYLLSNGALHGFALLSVAVRGQAEPGKATQGHAKPLDYKSLGKLCGTTDNGTTVDGMRKGLKSLGIESFAYRLNRQDLAKASLPAILLEGDHYVALLKLSADKATVYDTRFNSEREMKLPALDDPDFCVTAILFRALTPEESR